MKLVQHISALLAKWTPLVVALSATVSYFVPGAFKWAGGGVQTAMLGLIMLTMGTTLEGRDFKILVSRPCDIAIGTLAQFTLMPLIAWSLVHVMGFPKAVGAGLILVGCCPGGVSSNIMSFLCKGDVAFSVGMTTVSTLAAPVATPLLMLWLAGENIEVDAAGMVKSILFVTLLPVAGGLAANTAFAGRKGWQEAKKAMPGVAVAGLACIVGSVTSAHGARFSSCGPAVIAGVFLHNSLGYALGYAAGIAARFSPAKCRTVSIEVGMQNAGLATVLAARHFPAMPETAIVSAVSCVWHSISGALMAGVFNAADRVLQRNKTGTEPPDCAK